jgi:hypothetical protein
VWEAGASGDQPRMTHRRHDGASICCGLTQRSGGWINRIGRLTRGAVPGGVEIDLPGGGADEGNGRLQRSEHNLMPCRKNRLCIMLDCIACASRPVYIEYKSPEGQCTFRYIW